MSPPPHYVAATDFSACAELALARAARLARERGAELDLCHVASQSALDTLVQLFRSSQPDIRNELLRVARQRLDEAAAAIAAPGLAINAEVHSGSICRELLALADRTNAELLALGAQGESAVRDLLLGTTAERLIGRTRRPVLVVRRPATAPYHRVLVPVDFSPYSAPALRLALQLAPDAHITLFHAFHLPFEAKLRYAGVDLPVMERYLQETRLHANQALEDVIREAGAEGCAHLLTRAVAHGAAAHLILEQARHNEADLIVIGKRGHGELEELLFGSVTRRILADAPCDVLVQAHP